MLGRKPLGARVAELRRDRWRRRADERVEGPNEERKRVSLPRSDDEILLLHNPRCSKRRATKELLEGRGVEFETRLYLERPLDAGELRELGRRLGKAVRAFTRTKQAEFDEAGLSQDADEDAWLDALAETPILMERPIVIRGERAAIGRPPEDVLALLD